MNDDRRQSGEHRHGLSVVSAFSSGWGLMTRGFKLATSLVDKLVRDESTTLKSSQEDPEKKARALRLRNSIVDELVATESTYVSNLKLVKTVIIEPLVASASKTNSIIPRSDIDTLFSNFGIIAELNAQFEADLLELVARERGSPSFQDSQVVPVGDILLAFAPYFKMYTSYIKNHPHAVERLRVIKTQSKFAAFLRSVHEGECKQSLESYLIMPVQRVPRYQLLAQELLKRTPEDHSDYTALEKAIAKIKETAVYINDAVHKHESEQRMLQLQSQFTSGTELVSPGRSLVKQGALTKHGRSGQKSYEFFLFTDMLMYASKTLSGKFSAHQQLPIDDGFGVQESAGDVSLQSLNSINEDSVSGAPEVTAGDLPAHSFVVISNRKSFIVSAESDEAQKEWLLALRERIEEQRNLIDRRMPLLRHKSTPSEAFAHAPIMEAASHSQGCPVCGKRVSRIYRHHCHQCGRIVHGDCSRQKFILPGRGHNLHRVCDICARNITHQLEQELVEEKSTLKTSQSLPVRSRPPPPPPKPARPSLLREKMQHLLHLSNHRFGEHPSPRGLAPALPPRTPSPLSSPGCSPSPSPAPSPPVSPLSAKERPLPPPPNVAPFDVSRVQTWSSRHHKQPPPPPPR